MIYVTDNNPYSDGAHIAFLLDGRIGVSGTQYLVQRYFVRRVMFRLKLYSTQFDATVVKYSDKATLVVNYSMRFDLTEPSGRLQGMDNVLLFTSKYVFPSAGQNIPKIAILFVISEYSRPKNYGIASESLKQKGVHIFVIDVTTSTNPRELLNITEREDYLIRPASTFEMYFNFADYLVNKVLSAIGEY